MSSNIFPELSYQDGHRAIEWLNRAFGFEKRMVVLGPAGGVVHAELSFGPGVVMVTSGGGPSPAGGAQRPCDRHVTCVYLEEVDAHFERAKAAGAEIVREIEDTPYGARAYAARDLEGHVWHFSNYRPDSTKRDRPIP